MSEADGKVARRGLCLVLAGPSGAGKGAIGRALLAAEPALAFSVSATTRAPRAGEREGEHYHFLSPAAFDAMAASGGLLEWARVFGHSYGTPRAPVEAALAAGRDLLFDIDWQGYRQLRAVLPEDVVGVFLLPPSMSALAARLRGRGTDAEAVIARRLEAARDEIAHWPEFDHAVVNTDLPAAIVAVRAVLHAARLRTARQTGLAEFVAGLAA